MTGIERIDLTINKTQRTCLVLMDNATSEHLSAVIAEALADTQKVVVYPAGSIRPSSQQMNELGHKQVAVAIVGFNFHALSAEEKVRTIQSSLDKRDWLLEHLKNPNPPAIDTEAAQRLADYFNTLPPSTQADRQEILDAYYGRSTPSQELRHP